MTTEENAKNAEKYVCEICDFKCSKKSNYNTHIMTRKHKILQNPTEENAKNAEYICDCNKVYKHHSSLWNHKKKCNFIKSRHTLIFHYAANSRFLQKSKATFQKWTKKMSIFYFSIDFLEQKY